MTRAWTRDELAALDAHAELEVATARPDGTWRKYAPIWVVTAGGEVYVRTWYRRPTGWYGRAVAAGRLRVRTPGMEATATVDDVGPTAREAVDAAYRAKYAGGAERMVGDEAAATTLRLRPER